MGSRVAGCLGQVVNGRNTANLMQVHGVLHVVRHHTCTESLSLAPSGRYRTGRPCGACSSCWRGGRKAWSGPAATARMCVWRDPGVLLDPSRSAAQLDVEDE